jgi:hypothetical protein
MSPSFFHLRITNGTFVIAEPTALVQPLSLLLWYYVSPYNVPWLLLKPEGRQEARGKRRPQVISGFGPFGHTEPATLSSTLGKNSCTNLRYVAERQWILVGAAATDLPGGLAEIDNRAGPFCIQGYHTSPYKKSIKMTEMSFYCAGLGNRRAGA